ncbi:Galectin-4 [Salmo salar]|uniref:Galectin n=1 Tax=Salmo salar TaxID=8030 RepID=B9EPI0_SALSA|nr:Galectin-4 [Salmo salar]ACM09427.1 Galectin-4 [Salmo salar]|eukprot:NP_001140054.1 Galectin-4 [Salmo salar]
MFVAPPGYQPVYNPSIPYVGPIYGGLRSGMSVYIQGVIPHEITSFNMNLQCGESEGSDIGFHFSPRFDNWDKVVFNSCQEGEWGSEEEIHNMPFSKGDAFEMVIIIKQEGYQVAVNGQDLHTFNYRIPVERVNALQIGGDVSIQTISIIGGGNPGADQIGGNLPVMDGQTIFKPPVPYSSMIPGGMSPKKTIVIRGMVPLGANSFSINFMVGSSRDIVFHLNPRLQESVVVRNSLIGGSWDTEERERSALTPSWRDSTLTCLSVVGTSSSRCL